MPKLSFANRQGGRKSTTIFNGKSVTLARLEICGIILLHRCLICPLHWQRYTEGEKKFFLNTFGEEKLYNGRKLCHQI
jgi:hypothetical protein